MLGHLQNIFMEYEVVLQCKLYSCVMYCWLLLERYLCDLRLVLWSTVTFIMLTCLFQINTVLFNFSCSKELKIKLKKYKINTDAKRLKSSVRYIYSMFFYVE